MHARMLNESPERTYALVLQTGDEVVSTIERFAAGHALDASRITALGALQRVTLGCFDGSRKDYERIEFDEQLRCCR
jgi:predicted DNA-binding protein with PD1-like motif